MNLSLEKTQDLGSSLRIHWVYWEISRTDMSPEIVTTTNTSLYFLPVCAFKSPRIRSTPVKWWSFGDSGTHLALGLAHPEASGELLTLSETSLSH